LAQMQSLAGAGNASLSEERVQSYQKI